MGEDRAPLVGGDYLDGELVSITSSHFPELLFGPVDQGLHQLG